MTTATNNWTANINRVEGKLAIDIQCNGQSRFRRGTDDYMAHRFVMHVRHQLQVAAEFAEACGNTTMVQEANAAESALVAAFDAAVAQYGFNLPGLK